MDPASWIWHLCLSIRVFLPLRFSFSKNSWNWIDLLFSHPHSDFSHINRHKHECARKRTQPENRFPFSLTLFILFEHSITTAKRSIPSTARLNPFQPLSLQCSMAMVIDSITPGKSFATKQLELAISKHRFIEFMKLPSAHAPPLQNKAASTPLFFLFFCLPKASYCQRPMPHTLHSSKNILGASKRAIDPPRLCATSAPNISAMIWVGSTSARAHYHSHST